MWNARNVVPKSGDQNIGERGGPAKLELVGGESQTSEQPDITYLPQFGEDETMDRLSKYRREAQIIPLL